MNKILKRISFLLGTGILLGAVAACDDDDEELTSVEYDRLFAPTNLEFRVNEVDVTATWNCLSSADSVSYTIQIFANDAAMAFEGTATAEYTSSTTSCLMEGLEGATTYSFRVKAVGQSKESNWSESTFETDTEQILESVASADIGGTYVTLRWTADDGNVAYIVLTPSDDSAETVEYTITDEDLANGYAYIDELTPETAYTAVIYSEEGSVRGSRTFTTTIDTGSMTIVREGDDLAEAIEADNGKGLYLIDEAVYSIGTYELSKSVTIAGNPAAMPTIDGNFEIQPGVTNVTMNNVILNGNLGDSRYGNMISFTAGTYGSFTFSGCEFYDYTNNVYYINEAASIESISFDNCLFNGFDGGGGDFFDCRSGYIGELSITNSTIWNCAGNREMIRMDNASSTFGGSPKITVDHCTIDGAANSSSRCIFYVRYTGHTITFTNNILTNTPDCAGLTRNSSTNAPGCSGNDYYNVSDGVLEEDPSGMTYDPGYADADVGDFTVSNEELIYQGTGDPRWLE